MRRSSEENVVWLEVPDAAPTLANIQDSGKPTWNWKMRVQRCPPPKKMIPALKKSHGEDSE